MITIPNYEIGKLAGRGGVAEVYLARHKLLDRTVAIKLISPANADDLADKRFLKEAKVVAGLRHPNIVSIYDVGVYENKYYIIMEYLEGGDLKQNIKRSLSVPQILKIMRQIASALAHAHDRGFVHRDIKSQNIMFRGDGTAVLTDFGIVKDLSTDSGYTMDGTSIGTPHYMSPEQVQGTGEVDWRTDLYSLGATLYEMLTGTVPYNADSPVAVALKHIKDPVPELPEAFAEFQPLIDKLMAKKPGDRFQSAHELLHALSALDGEPVSAETMVLRHGPGKKIRLANIFTGVLIGCVLVGLIMLVQPHIASFISGPPQTADAPALKSTAPEKTASAEQAPPAPKPPAKEKTELSRSGDLDSDRLTDLITAKNYSQTLDYISQSRQNLPNADSDLLRKADKSLAAGQYMNAGDIFNTILSADNKNLSAILGSLYVALKKQQSVMTAEPPDIAEFESLMAVLNKAIINSGGDSGTPYFRILKINAVETVYDIARRRLAQQNLAQAAAWAAMGVQNAPDHLRLRKLENLVQAEIRLADNRLTQPDGDSALYYYQQVLKLDPQDSGAEQGLKKIIAHYETMARAALEENNLDIAMEQVRKARSIPAPDPAANSELAQLEWLIQGDIYAARGQFTIPEGSNARHYYQKILTQNPQNKAAAQRMATMPLRIALFKIQQENSLSEKLPDYTALFERLDAMKTEPDKEKTDGFQRLVLRQIQEDITHQKQLKRPIPKDFVTLVDRRFPDETGVADAQYDIFVALGDESRSAAQKTEYYLNALKLNPSLSPARKKIAVTAREMEAAGNSESADTLLQQALEIVPKDDALTKIHQTLKKRRDTTAELFTLVLKIRQLPSLETKMELYETLFAKLETAEKTQGAKNLETLKKDIASQITADIAARKNLGQPLPLEFTALLRHHFPEISDAAARAQYDIFIKIGDQQPEYAKKTDAYLKALVLAPERETARKKIEQLVVNLEKNGKNAAAVAVLEQAMAARPNDLIFSELFEKIKQSVAIYPTDAGCGRERSISQAVVSIENLNLCIEYRNLPQHSVVTLTVSQSNAQAMEVPVILIGRSGTMPVNMPAPVEGFSTGEYQITVRQNNKTVAENRIQIIPKRR